MRKRRERSGLVGPLLVVVSTLEAASTMASTVVVDGTDIAYQNPSASGDGRTIALERVLYEDGAMCADAVFTDVAVYRPTIGCGSKVLTLVTRDGRSSDPSASADGNWIAWRTQDGTTTRFIVARADGSDREEVFTCDGGDVADLEISPLGDYIAFRAFDCSDSNVEEIIRVEVGDPYVADVVASMPSAGDLGLNRHRCFGSNGVVYYSKGIGGSHDLYRRAPGASAQTLVATSDDERNISSDCLMGLTALFRRTSASGIDNLFTVSTTGTVRQLTSNASASWDIGPATIARDGYSFVMESDGNFTSGNGDGGMEVYFGSFADTGLASLSQVTDVPEPPPLTYAVLHVVMGSTLADPGCLLLASDAVFVSSVVVKLASPCRAADLNELRLTQYPLRTADVAGNSIVPEVVPSFEVILDPAVDVATGCGFDAVDDWVRTCTLGIVTAADAGRRVLVQDAWTVEACLDAAHGAVELDVPAKSYRYVTLRLANCYDSDAPGTVSIDVTSPDSGQPDVHQVTWTYP